MIDKEESIEEMVEKIDDEALRESVQKATEEEPSLEQAEKMGLGRKARLDEAEAESGARANPPAKKL